MSSSRHQLIPGMESEITDMFFRAGGDNKLRQRGDNAVQKLSLVRWGGMYEARQSF
jgi:hypothetical protein